MRITLNLDYEGLNSKILEDTLGWHSLSRTYFEDGEFVIIHGEDGEEYARYDNLFELAKYYNINLPDFLI